MEDIFTLFTEKTNRNLDEMILLLEKVYNSSLFDSQDLHIFLDQHQLKAPQYLVKRIKDFHDSSLQMPLQNQEIAEVILN
jgi:hypothetical protein